MQDCDRILDAFDAWRGAPMALATVLSTWGSAPRPRGSHMLVQADGRLEGSVSGGCVETDILATAETVIRKGRAIVRHYGIAQDQAWEAGLPCGGSIDVLVQPVAEDGFPNDLFDLIRRTRREGASLAVSTDITSGRSWPGASARAGIFVNRYDPPGRLLIVGAVEIAQHLARLGSILGMDVVVNDPRARFLTAERFPDVLLDDRWPDEAIRDYRPGISSGVVVLSHDPKIDDPALVAALDHKTGYIAALGSRRSHADRCRRLADLGVGRAAITRIEGPAGLAIGAVGTAEIAVSIGAGLVAALRRSIGKEHETSCSMGRRAAALSPGGKHAEAEAFLPLLHDKTISEQRSGSL